MNQVKIRFFYFVIIVGVFVSNTAVAGVSSGHVTFMLQPTANVFFFALESRSNAPACVDSNVISQFVFATDGPGGKNLLALILTAQAEGKTITVTGTNDCSAGWNREAVAFITIP